MVGACETRMKFLGRLGIHPNHRASSLPSRRIHPLPIRVDSKKPQNSKHAFPESIGNKRSAPGTLQLGAPSATNSESEELRSSDEPKVKFVGSVRVRWIPNRCDYSPATRSALWSSRDEVLEGASRNTIEFAYEGWDIQKVLEDESMVDYFGQSIHPVHFCEVEDRKAYLCDVMQRRNREKHRRQCAMT